MTLLPTDDLPTGGGVPATVFQPQPTDADIKKYKTQVEELKKRNGFILVLLVLVVGMLLAAAVFAISASSRDSEQVADLQTKLDAKSEALSKAEKGLGDLANYQRIADLDRQSEGLRTEIRGLEQDPARADAQKIIPAREWATYRQPSWSRESAVNALIEQRDDLLRLRDRLAAIAPTQRPREGAAVDTRPTDTQQPAR